MASMEEPVYCVCRKPYDITQFMIECDKCKDWFHGSCVNVKEDVAKYIEIYHCPRCQEEFGPLVLKKRRNWHRHDYSEAGDGKAVQTGTPVFMKELKSRTFLSGSEVVKRLSGHDLTPEYFEEHRFDCPILVEKKEGLGLRVPPPSLTVDDIERKVGPLHEIDVIDVSCQEDRTMLMRDWKDYFNSPERHDIYNVISLEFSKTPLSEMVDPPLVVKQVSWVSSLWPEDMPDEMVPERPDVQKYCLMGVKDSFTDFHIDFGGTSVWYHVLKGEKVFYLIKPTETNLSLYENWCSSATQNETFFGDQVDRCWRMVVKQGQTMFIPTGWIHAVLTPIDSLVFGGNFLHNFNIPLQLECYEIERHVKTPEKYLFPSYETVNWYAAKHVLDILKGHTEDGSRPKQYIIDGGAALAVHLKKWTQRKDYSRKGDNPAELEGIQYGKLIRALNSEVKLLGGAQKSPKSLRSPPAKSSKKKSDKKKKKKSKGETTAPTPISTGLSMDLPQLQPEDLKVLDDEQRKNIYNFEDDDSEKLPVFKIRLPKPTAEEDSAKSKRKKGGRGKKGKKGNKRGSQQEEVKEEPAVASPDKSKKMEGDNTIMKFRLSNGHVVMPSGSKQAQGRGEEAGKPLTVEKKPGFQPLLPVAKEEEDDDSEGDNLVVDEHPPPRVPPKKIKLTFSLGAKGKGKGKRESLFDEAKSESKAFASPSDSVRRGLNGSIADILEASGYSTETTLKGDNSKSFVDVDQKEAVAGMLYMCWGKQGGDGNNPLFEPLSPGVCRPPRPKEAKDEEEQFMSDCHQHGEYMYPSFEPSEEERLGGKAVKQEKDDNWNPKGRVNVSSKAEERTQRVGAKNQAIASGLAATAKKLAESPPVSKSAKKGAGGKGKVVEKEFEVEPLPGPSTDFVGAGNAFRPGVKRAVDTTPTITPSKPKKPKKGQATAKQRLSKILKMNKMRF